MMITIRQFYAATLLTALMVCPGFASTATVSAAQRFRPHHGGEPDRIFFFIYIMDIDAIDGQEQSFTVNLVLRLRWKDERLAHQQSSARVVPLEEVWIPDVLLTNCQAGMRSKMPEVVDVQSDGTVMYRQQYVGPLSQRLLLSDFPLDTQSFCINFMAARYRCEEVEFVPDRISEMDEVVGGAIATELSLPDWTILGHTAEARPFEFGTARIAGFALEFTARRHFPYYLWQVILPLVLIVIMSWAPFWVDPAKAELQFGIASSTVITLIAYRFLLSALLPRLPYLTRMDYLTLISTILVFASFLQVLLTTVLAHGKRVGLARGIDCCCRVVFPAVFVALLILLLVV